MPHSASRTLDLRITAVHLSDSILRKAANSCGVLAITSAASADSLPLTSRDFKAYTVPSYSVRSTGAGVAAGSIMPYQPVTA